jgi:hypothetical protein
MPCPVIEPSRGCDSLVSDAPLVTVRAELHALVDRTDNIRLLRNLADLLRSVEIVLATTTVCGLCLLA